MTSNQTKTEGHPSIPRKRQNVTLKMKVHIINKFESGEKISQISKNLNLPNSTVSSIIRDKKRILAALKNNSVFNSSTIIRKRHGIIARMECTLKKWWQEQVQQNVRVTRNDISFQAKMIFEELKKDYGNASKNETFLASKGWYFRFKQRCEGQRIIESEGVHPEDKTPVAQVKKERDKDETPILDNTNINTESAFSNQLKMVIKEGGYTSQTVFNVDEIGLYWKKMPEGSSLAHHREENISGFNESKDRLTILLGGNAAGDFRLKPLVIYRVDNPRALHNKSKSGLPVIWKSNSKAAMTSSLFEDWFGHYFIPEVEKYCYTNNIPCKVLLVIDSAGSHLPTTLVHFDHRVNVMFLPPEDTCSMQPMYRLSKIFTAMYTRNVFGYLIKTCRENDVLTAEELWKEFNILDAIRIIVDSWTEISENVWNKSWYPLCPIASNTNDLETECDTSSKIVEEIINVALELDIKVDRKEVCKLLHSHYKDLTIEELIDLDEYSYYEEMEAHDPLQGEETMTVKGLTEAINHIKTGLQILENIDLNEQRARTTKLSVMKLLSVYEKILNEMIVAANIGN